MYFDSTKMPTRAKGRSADSVEVKSAEAAVACVLDNNRTLDSAAFAGGKTALHHAACRGDDYLVRVLLERGCKPHLKVRTLAEETR